MGRGGLHLTPDLPRTRFARGPLPDGLVGREDLDYGAATGHGLSAVPAALERLTWVRCPMAAVPITPAGNRMIHDPRFDNEFEG